MFVAAQRYQDARKKGLSCSKASELPALRGVGPVPGVVVLCCGLVYDICCVALAIGTYCLDRHSHKNGTSSAAMG